MWQQYIHLIYTVLYHYIIVLCPCIIVTSYIHACMYIYIYIIYTLLIITIVYIYIYTLLVYKNIPDILQLLQACHSPGLQGGSAPRNSIILTSTHLKNFQVDCSITVIP